MSAAIPQGFVHRRRRGAELFLLIISLVVGIGAYAAVGLGVKGRVPGDIYTYGGWLVLLLVVAHVVVRYAAPYADPVLLPVVAALNGVGLAEIHRLDLSGTAGTGNLASKQLVWMTIGVVLFAAVLLGIRDHRRLQAFTYSFGLAAIVLLLLPMLPVIGESINGARIWIRLGPLSFQPGEVAKIALVLFFAGYLVVHRDALALAGRRFGGIDFPRGRDLGPILLMWLVSMGVLVFQSDLGSSLLFFGLFVVMLYVSTERPGWLVLGAVLFGVGSSLAYLVVAHVQVRVVAWLHPFSSSVDSYQLVQGLYGMAWGGLVGRGLGLGDPGLTPLGYSDFIIASLGEEIGLVGLFAVLCLYLLFVSRGLRIGFSGPDDFGKLFAVGLSFVFALQCFIVIGGVMRVIPETGLTTPFLAAGGSSLVANWMIAALLLRISDTIRSSPRTVI